MSRSRTPLAAKCSFQPPMTLTTARISAVACVFSQCELVAHRQRVLERRVRAVQPDAHLLIAEGLPGRQDIERWRQLVLLRVVDQQHVVLLVIVGVVEEDVEHHAAEKLSHLGDVHISLRRRRVGAGAAPAPDSPAFPTRRFSATFADSACSRRLARAIEALDATAWPSTRRIACVRATRMRALRASVIDACSIRGVSAGSSSENFTTHCSPLMSRSALGRAPPIVTPGASRRFCADGMGSSQGPCGPDHECRPCPRATGSGPICAADILVRRRDTQRAESVVARKVEKFEQRQPRRLVEQPDDPLAPTIRPCIVDRACRRVLSFGKELLGDAAAGRH